MSIKKVVIIAVAAFVVIVVLAIGLSARFSLSNIVDDPYAFIEKFFSQWSLALSAAGTIILALSVFSFIYENRRREERENRQAIHALHDEILWNLNNVVMLRFRISEYIRYINEHNTTPSVPGPFELLETRVFDDMRSRGQLYLLEDLRMHILPGYKLIRDYNMDNHYKLHHLELLKNIHEGFERNIRALEAKFDFLPRYIKDREDEEGSKVENGDNRRNREG